MTKREAKKIEKLVSEGIKLGMEQSDEGDIASVCKLAGQYVLEHSDAKDIDEVKSMCKESRTIVRGERSNWSDRVTGIV